MPSIQLHKDRFIQVTVDTYEQLSAVDKILKENDITVGICTVKVLYAYTQCYGLVYALVHKALTPEKTPPVSITEDLMVYMLTCHRIDRCLPLDQVWPLRYHSKHLEVYTENGWVPTQKFHTFSLDHPSRYKRLLTILNDGVEPHIPVSGHYLKLMIMVVAGLFLILLVPQKQ